MIDQKILGEFKERMHLGDFEDDNLLRILTSSYEDLLETCGDYTLEDETFKELVFERSRYVYNDALEYFEENFLTRINTLAMRKALNEDESEQIQS
ncbi:MAG TPA: phage gp6-like head-tail connector protein [Alloiococcus sp.]|nr:phage gp6-like head-tail connector protein [Alloiococcus sp.]